MRKSCLTKCYIFTYYSKWLVFCFFFFWQDLSMLYHVNLNPCREMWVICSTSQILASIYSTALFCCFLIICRVLQICTFLFIYLFGKECLEIFKSINSNNKSRRQMSWRVKDSFPWWTSASYECHLPFCPITTKN